MSSRELYESVMSEGVGYPDLVKAWSLTCGRAVDWLISSGVKVNESAAGRVWLDQAGEVSLAPVYKKDVGTRALASLKKRLNQLGGSYVSGVKGEKLIYESGRICGVIAHGRANRSNCGLAQLCSVQAASALIRNW